LSENSSPLLTSSQFLYLLDQQDLDFFWSPAPNDETPSHIHSMSSANCEEISDSQLLDFVQQIEIPPHVEKDSMDLSNYDDEVGDSQLLNFAQQFEFSAHATSTVDIGSEIADVRGGELPYK
jgi:hypothetical protein